MLTHLPLAAGCFFPLCRLLADNKFSSFVRQLNFYGFRKVKSNITVEGHDTKWWEFKVGLVCARGTCQCSFLLQQ